MDLREYRVWQADDVYACVTVSQEGFVITVYADGDDSVQDFGYLHDAYRAAQDKMYELFYEAMEACPCGESAEDCGWAYDAPHAVRWQVVDCVENRELNYWEW